MDGMTSDAPASPALGPAAPGGFSWSCADCGTVTTASGPRMTAIAARQARECADAGHLVTVPAGG